MMTNKKAILIRESLKKHVIFVGRLLKARDFCQRIAKKYNFREMIERKNENSSKDLLKRQKLVVS